MTEIRTSDEHLTLSRQRQQIHAGTFPIHRAVDIAVKGDLNAAVAEDLGKSLDVETKLKS